MSGEEKNIESIWKWQTTNHSLPHKIIIEMFYGNCCDPKIRSHLHKTFKIPSLNCKAKYPHTLCLFHPWGHDLKVLRGNHRGWLHKVRVGSRPRQLRPRPKAPPKNKNFLRKKGPTFYKTIYIFSKGWRFFLLVMLRILQILLLAYKLLCY